MIGLNGIRRDCWEHTASITNFTHVWSIRSLNNYMIFTYSYHRVYYELKIGHLSMWLDSSVDRALHWIRRSWVWITFKPEIFSGCFSTAYIVSWEHTARITNFTIYTVWLLCLKSPVKGASIKMYVCMYAIIKSVYKHR